MCYGMEINGMRLNDEDRDAARSRTERILQTYGKKLKKQKGEEDNG